MPAMNRMPPLLSNMRGDISSAVRRSRSPAWRLGVSALDVAVIVQVVDEAQEAAEHHQAGEHPHDPERLRAIQHDFPGLQRGPVVSLKDARQAQVQEHDEDTDGRQPEVPFQQPSAVPVAVQQRVEQDAS